MRRCGAVVRHAGAGRRAGHSAHTTGMQVTIPTAEQLELLAGWRALALGRMPNMASYLFSLRVLAVPGLGTFAVDPGFRLYVDFDAVQAKGPDWCAESLLQEVGHLFGEHHAFAQDVGVADHHRKIWNAATDFSLNDEGGGRGPVPAYPLVEVVGERVVAGW